jgi:hypothetical protein
MYLFFLLTDYFLIVFLFILMPDSLSLYPTDRCYSFILQQWFIPSSYSRYLFRPLCQMVHLFPLLPVGSFFPRTTRWFISSYGQMVLSLPSLFLDVRSYLWQPDRLFRPPAARWFIPSSYSQMGHLFLPSSYS